MFVYFQWSKNGQHHVQAFHKLEKAVEYVINHIDTCTTQKQGLYDAAVKKKAARPAAIFFDDAMDAQGGADMHPVAPAPAPGQLPDVFHFHNQPLNLPQDRLTEKTEPAEKKVSIELVALREHMVIAKKNKTHENALKAIELYEAYLKYAINNESAIHTLQDIDIVE